MRISLIFIIPFLFTSCAIYAPQVTPPILVENAGDVQFDIGITAPFSIGVQSNVAVAISDHVAFQISGRAFEDKNFIVDGSIGASTNLGERSRIGLFAGFSKGKGANNYNVSSEEYTIDGTSNLVYGKAQYLIHRSKVDFAITTKLGQIKQDFYYIHTRHEFGYSDPLEEEDIKLNAFFVEPAFSVIFKLKKIKLIGTAALIHVNSSTIEQKRGVFPINFGMSVEFLGKGKKKAPSTE